MWDLPGPGLEPMSPALAGGFLTIVPPGKSLNLIYIIFSLLIQEPCVFISSFMSFKRVLRVFKIEALVILSLLLGILSLLFLHKWDHFLLSFLTSH